jgi:hypothetical protein
MGECLTNLRSRIANVPRLSALTFILVHLQRTCRIQQQRTKDLQPIERNGYKIVCFPSLREPHLVNARNTDAHPTHCIGIITTSLMRYLRQCLTVIPYLWSPLGTLPDRGLRMRT